MKNDWISVEDRFPEHNQVCLCVDNFDTIYVLKWWGKIFPNWTYPNCTDTTGIYHPLCGIITHWMPLPEPPKEENNEHN